MIFKTKFNLEPRVLRDYDPNDNVDRLSYLDTTKQIQMFMRAGTTLQMNMAQAQYHFDDDLNDDNGVFVPVYAPDINEIKVSLENIESKLKVETSKKKSDLTNEEKADNFDSAKTEAVDSSNSEG